jgi:hypothetical protein
MLDNTDKAERFWASMLTYQELAEEAEFSFQLILQGRGAVPGDGKGGL